MGKDSKRLKKMRMNPKNVPFRNVDSVLLSLGFDLKRIKGSHHHYTIEIDGETHILTIPFKRPHIKSIYVKQVLSLIDSLELSLGEDKNDEESNVEETNNDENS